MKLKYFLLLIVLLLIGLEAGLLIYYGIDRYSENIERFEKQNLEFIADDFESTIKNYEELKVTTDYFIKNTEVLSKIIFENVHQLRFLTESFKNKAGIDRALIVNYSGKIMYNRDRQPAAIAGEKNKIQEIRDVKFEDTAVFAFYQTPIHYNNQIIGAISVYKKITNEYIKRFGDNNNTNIIIDTAAAATEDTVSILKTMESIELRKVITDISGEKITFIFKHDLNPIKNALYEANRHFIVMNIIIALIVYVFGYFIIHFLLRSLKKLTVAADNIASGVYTLPLKNTAVKEINSVIKSFNKMNAELKKTQEFVIQQEKLYLAGKLASGMAHELNNPLVAALGYTQMLQENEKLKDEKICNYLKQIENNILRARSIVKSLRSYSVMKNSMPAEIKIKGLIDECIAHIKYHIAGKSIKINNLIEDDFIVSADVNILHQVIVNLFINSIDAIENAKDGLIEARSYIEEKNKIIEISDNGSGIDDKTMPNIFEPFFTTKPEGKGSGLGLFLCYNYMKQLNAEIKVENKTDEHSTVTGVIVKLIF